MATPPSQVRRALQVVTGAAQAEIRAVSTAAKSDPQEWRAAMFAAMPLVVAEYGPATSALALDWFEEIRAEASVSRPFVPTPRLHVTDEDVAAAVASITESLRDIERQIAADSAQLLANLTAELEAAVQKEVAAGFWDTITENTRDDPDAVGWKRHAQPGACKFCLMLAERGAVYTRETARFAAHTTCHCIAGPEFGGQDEWAEASPMQYVASKRKRTARERAALREYLNTNFPDAPG